MQKLLQKMNAGKSDGERIDSMRKDVVESLNRSMSAIKSGNLDDRKAAVQGLREVRSELINLSHETGIDSTDMLNSLDAMIENGEKQVGLFKSLVERMSPKRDVFSKFKEGFWSEASPFLKLAANVATAAKDRTKEIIARSKESSATEEDLEAAAESIKDASKKLEQAAKTAATPKKEESVEPAKEQGTLSPPPTVVPVTQPPAPSIQKVVPDVEKQNPTPRMETWDEWQKTLEKDKGQLDKPKVERAMPERDQTGKFKPKDGVQKPKMTAEQGLTKTDEATSRAIENLTAAIESRFSDAPKTDDSHEQEKKLLESIDKELVDIKGLQEQTLAMAKQQSLQGSKDRLRVKKDKPSLLGGAAKPEAKGLSMIGGAIQGALSGILGGAIPMILGFIGKAVTSVGKTALKLLNPMNWVRGAQAVFEALKPSNIMGAASKAGAAVKGLFTSATTNVLGKAKDIAGGVKEGLSTAGKAISKLGESGKGILKAGKTLLQSAKTVPVVGQILAAGLAVYDFFDGYSKAADILGKDAAELTTWDKVSAGIGKAIGSVTGIIDSIGSLFGFDWKIEETVTGFVAKNLADLPETVSKWASDAGELFTSMKDTVSEWVSNLMEGAAKAIAENVPGGKWLLDKVGGLFKSDEPKPVRRGDIDKEIPTPENLNKPVDSGPTREQKLEMLAAIDRPSNDLAGKTAEHDKFMDKVEDKAAAQNVVTAVDNRKSVVNNNSYTNTPLTTRNPDDSHRRGLQ
ncbi:hypothetical protein [Delftia phage PhiW-14]|uniref:Uncharacterized protein n=1 Tax=Delftia phage PhiW-14 TaxID=665032 RepID=C9DFX6_BPW14|nr:hypothetical protein DP-phiW-14_gp004 [Delftia phage PhiW-14]ACV50027.1 hypothetical protein [Delftia phage PhiW-14]